MPDLLDRLRAALADRYTIERELGAGGMATVYLAHDVKHHRQVALKVMRPDIAATVGAGRFAREIEVAARLQHPNILPLLDSGEVEGVFFYVMPYVEGESLRDRLARGGELPIPEAVRILMEVADALSEAHSHGVVHRDIKPDNVMLRGRHALVADFGVAKAVTEATGQQLLTSTGVALGTPTYMAPEQATADPHQDHRVDIYALGVLGYELLTGRAPFSATTAAEMLAAHLTAQPEPVERYRESVSPALAAVVMKCLAKKPADRWQTAEEVLQHLEPLATPSGGTTPTQTRPIIALGNVPRWGKWAAGVGAVAVIALVVAELLKPMPLAVTAYDLTRVTDDPGVEFQPAISPDGNEVVYVAGPVGGGIAAAHVFLRSAVSAATGAAVRLGDTTTGSEWFPSWSPDGQMVRLWGCPPGAQPDSRCTWLETGKLGGATRQLLLPPRAREADVLWYAAWSPDGSRMAFPVDDSLLIVTTADGRTLAIPGAGGQSLAWSPDGALIAYTGGNPYWATHGIWLGGSSLWVVSAAGGRPYRVAPQDRLNVSPAWLDDRHLLFVSDRDGQRAVYVVEAGPHGVRGEPRSIPGPTDPHSISYSPRSHRLAFAKFTAKGNIWAYPLGRSAPISIRDGRRVTTGGQVIEWLDVSPDGNWIVFNGDLRGRPDLYKVPSAGGQPTQLTSGDFGPKAPRWSPDGREVAFFTTFGTGPLGPYQIMVVPAAGGAPVALTDSASGAAYPSWSPDGRHIAFQSGKTGQGLAWLVSRDSVGAPWGEAVPFSDSSCFCPDWAPDGSRLVCVHARFVSAQNGHTVGSDLFARNHLRNLSTPHFSRDGRTIYNVAIDQAGRRGVWAIPVSGAPARLVVAFDDPSLAAVGGLGVSRDELYVAVGQYESDIWVANLRY